MVYQNFASGWKAAGIEAENKRAKMLEAFNAFKQDNPDATAAEFQEYVNNVTGGRPWMRGALPAEEILNQIGSRNQNRIAEENRLAGLKEESNRLEHLTKKNALKNSLNESIRNDMLSATKEEMESGSFTRKWLAGNQELAEVYGGGDMSDVINLNAFNKVHSDFLRDNYQDIMRMLESDPDISNEDIASRYGVNPKNLEGAANKMREDIKEADETKTREQRNSVMDFIEKQTKSLMEQSSLDQDPSSENIKSQIMGLLNPRLGDGEGEKFISANVELMDGWIKKIQTGANAIKTKELERVSEIERGKKKAIFTEAQAQSTATAKANFGERGHSHGAFSDDQKALSMKVNLLVHEYAANYFLNEDQAAAIMINAQTLKGTESRDVMRDALMKGVEGAYQSDLASLKDNWKKPTLRRTSEWASNRDRAIDHMGTVIEGESSYGRTISDERAKVISKELQKQKQELTTEARDVSWQDTRSSKPAGDYTDDLIKKIDALLDKLR